MHQLDIMIYCTLDRVQ